MPLEDQSGKVPVLKLVCLSFTDWQLFLGDALMIFRFMIYQIEQKCIKITTKTKKNNHPACQHSISGSFFIIYIYRSN